MTWDLAEVIAEREQPRTTVIVYLNEVASHAKTQLERALATEKDADRVAELEAKLTEVDEALQATKYTVTLEALPVRFRKDINAEANRQFPYRRNPLGGLANDDPTQERMELENNLLFAAMLRDVENPKGDSKAEWPKEEAFQFIEALPASGQKSIDQAMRQLHEDAEKHLTEVTNPNF